MTKDLNVICVPDTATMKDVMESIQKSGIRAAFVVDGQRKLKGVVTDGDIRQATLTGKDLNTPAKNIMISDVITATKEAPASRLLEIMTEKSIYQIPIVGPDGVMMDVVLLMELKQIPLSKQEITASEVEIIKDILTSPYLTLGPKVKEFESIFAKYIGVKHAIAVNSGTSGLHLAMRALDIKDGDEVITTPFSFISSANAILYERAKPVFVDIEEKTFCIDPTSIEEKITSKTKAILPVDIFGYVADMDPILEIAKKHNLKIIEDACEALGSEYKSRRAGSFGDVAAFGFAPNKQVTTGEGGMIVTNNDDVARLCRSMRNYGKDEGTDSRSFSQLGFSCRLNELSAALGVSQMQRIEEILARRNRIATLYTERLRKIVDVITPRVPDNTKMSWFVYVVRLNPEKFSREERDAVIAEMEQLGVNCRDRFPPIHLEPLYTKLLGHKEGDFPVTERVSWSTIALPFHNNLAEEEINYVCDSLEKVLAKVK